MTDIKTDNADTGAETAQAAGGEPVVALNLETVTPEQFEELKQQATKATEHWDRLLRTTADFDNFRKRATREKQDAVRYANESLLEKLLPVLDSFDMAIAASQNAAGEAAQSLQAGVKMVHQQLRNVLAESGLEEIDAAGKPFDPNLHEAIAQQPNAEVPEGQVLVQVRKGYRLRERLLRPASVVVASKPS